jgi:hypothetical protein
MPPELVLVDPGMNLLRKKLRTHLVAEIQRIKGRMSNPMETSFDASPYHKKLDQIRIGMNLILRQTVGGLVAAVFLMLLGLYLLVSEIRGEGPMDLVGPLVVFGLGGLLFVVLVFIFRWFLWGTQRKIRRLDKKIDKLLLA